MTKRALITGITGQDGSYLAELLLSLGYTVCGVVRREALEDPSSRMQRIEHLLDRLDLFPASLENYPSVHRIFSENAFDECYHLAAQSFVAENFVDGFATMNTNINSTHYLLATIRELQPKCRFYFAGSSEMFGKVSAAPQAECTPLHPRSSYGISKVAGFHLTRNYRESYGLYCSTGILFNHESPRRGTEFVTRKITRGAARIKHKLANEVRLGNLDAQRDWGHAKDYVQAMHLMLQHETGDDFVIATGKTHTVREFCQMAFETVGLNYEDYVKMDPAFYREAEPIPLLGDPGKAERLLGWRSTTSFQDLVAEMVESDLRKLSSSH